MPSEKTLLAAHNGFEALQSLRDWKGLALPPHMTEELHGIVDQTKGCDRAGLVLLSPVDMCAELLSGCNPAKVGCPPLQRDHVHQASASPNQSGALQCQQAVHGKTQPWMHHTSVLEPGKMMCY